MRKGTVRAYVPDGILVDAFEFHSSSALVVDASERIVNVCHTSDLPSDIDIIDCSSQIFVAAPILAHAHLESFDAPSADFQCGSFSQWVTSLLDWRDSADRLSPEESAQLSRQELFVNGCGLVATHVGEERAEGDLEPGLPEVIALTEVFQPSGEIPTLPDFPYRGVALHSSFSVADNVASHIFSLASDDNFVSLHLGEHIDERQFLESATGEMADLFIERGLELKSDAYSSPVDWLEKMGGLKPSVVAVHCSNLSAKELAQLNHAGVDVVFCPGTHKYFRRERPAFGDVPSLLPALGCDSRASNTVLDPLRELRLAAELIPEISCQMWWQSLTGRGAEVLKRQDLGSLSKGKLARVLRLSTAELGHPQSAGELCSTLCSTDNLSRELLSLNSSTE